MDLSHLPLGEQLQPNWRNIEEKGSISFTCGYCGGHVDPHRAYYHENFGTAAIIYICTRCFRPTYFETAKSADQSVIIQQFPGAAYGKPVRGLPPVVGNLYNEVRKAMGVNANTLAVLGCRKILMNVSVDKGAKAGESFASYVTYLNDKHFIPPDGKEWADKIRSGGNEATHEIPPVKRQDAEMLVDFVEMLLTFVYEFPKRMLENAKP
jgi:hypothetical protein